MNISRRSKALIAVITLAMTVSVLPQAIAQCTFLNPPILYGTLGACDNDSPGGPCTRTSTLVELDPWTGALLKTIGPIGFTVNGLAWDHVTKKLYATTAVGDTAFHGLITIDPKTGIGTPVNPTVVNFGLEFTAGTPESPVHSITIDSLGNMVGWYDEFGGPTDTFVRINKRTGRATEFPNTGIDTSQNGVSFSDLNLLWNIDSPREVNGTLTQTAYLLNPLNGKPLLTKTLTPPTNAALGDFHPSSNLYYGLNFLGGKGINPTSIVVVDLKTGVVTGFTSTISDLHTIAFVK